MKFLQVGKNTGNVEGIGYNDQDVMNKRKEPGVKIVHPKKRHMSNQMSKHQQRHHKSYSRSKTQQWRYHYCERYGHIKPYYYRIFGFTKPITQPKRGHTGFKTKKIWIPKTENSALLAHTSLRASTIEDWYFDSGCSRHMTSVKKFLVGIKPHSTSYVTFGDGSKGEIKGVGKLDYTRLPSLDNVLFVKGITTNLISISQICDQGLKVNFNKSECFITNENNEVVMKGARSKDNCYLWTPPEIDCFSTCLMTKEDEVNLWNQKLGHLHLKGMKKILSKEVVRGSHDQPI